MNALQALRIIRTICNIFSDADSDHFTRILHKIRILLIEENINEN